MSDAEIEPSDDGRITFSSKEAARLVLRVGAVDAVGAARGLLPGPDLYTWFRARPDRLADGLHPDAEGSVEMSRLWAEAVSPLYPR